MKWIKFSEEKPPIDTDVLVWVMDDFQCCDIGRWNTDTSFCNGWDTNSDLSKYREITHWAYLPKKPSKK